MNAARAILVCLAACALAAAQTSSTPTPPGSSLPGLGGVAMGLDGPGYIEIGGSHNNLTGEYPNWNDFYMRGMISGGRNAFTGEITRENRFGDSGWYGDVGVIRTLSDNWYAQGSAGASVGGFFLPRVRFDGAINRKLLQHRQLVVTGGMGFDHSRTVNKDLRGLAEASYYFNFPLVLQGGFMWTYSTPGDVVARTQHIAATEGHDKEHFISLRYEWGREGYEVIGPPSDTTPGYNVVFDFPEHTAGVTWRQWIGPNWGFNLNVEQHSETSYHRLGGTIGVFLDF
jgi:YaiO family outer membrane protein